MFYQESNQELSARWRQDTVHMSSPTAIAMHPAYQQIIGMGPQVLPLILHELDGQSEDGQVAQWFWALKAICGTDPVPSQDKGRPGAMAAALVRFGRERGLI